jgi:hypothetical protein
MNFGDNPLLIGVPHERRTIQFSMYAQYLCCGGTFHFNRVKKATIDKYLLAAASLVSSATGIDPRKDTATDKSNTASIVRLLADYQFWESRPNRREPWTPELQRNLDHHIATQPIDEFGILSVIADFTATGLYTGCRISEYAQTSAAGRAIGHHARDPHDHSTVAFTLRDVSFFQSVRPITHPTLVDCSSIDDAYLLADLVTINWSTQKNGDRDEKKSYHKNLLCRELCPVYRFLRIVLRFIKLMGTNNDIPLSVFRNPKGRLLHLIRTDIDTVLQATVIRHFQLSKASDKETIARWTTHSIRVGACNILFGAGVKDHVIQFRLRWRSMTFMTYFRNIGAISQEQTDAVNLAIEQPQLFY